MLIVGLISLDTAGPIQLKNQIYDKLNIIKAKTLLMTLKCVVRCVDLFVL